MAHPRNEPPPGEPWDLPLAEAPLVFLDLEMTGLDAASDRVVELCAERVVGARVEASLETLVRPDCGAFGNAHIHGIDLGALAFAPTFAEVAPRVLALLEGAALVAHAAAWDVAFLEAELARAGSPLRIGHYLDTLTLARRGWVLPSHSLAALCRAFGVPPGQAHRAGDDVRALRGVWPHVLAPLGAQTPRDLWHVRVGERHARPEVVAAAMRAEASPSPVLLRYRPARRPIEEHVLRVTSVRTDLDPPRVLGYLLPSRSRREFRADRILAIEAELPRRDPSRRP
jgi:DNA polymerase-3 subunit epsilon